MSICRRVLAIASLAVLSYAQDAEPPAPGLAPWSWPTTPTHARIGRALREVRRAGPTANPRIVLGMLEAGGDVPEVLVDILTRQRVPEGDAEDKPQILNEEQRDALLSAVTKSPKDRIREALEKALDASPEDDKVRLGAVFALSVVGSANDLSRVVELAPRKANGTDALTPAARDAVRAAALGILQRDSNAWGRLPEVVSRCDERCARSLLEGLGQSKDPRVLGILYQVGRKREVIAPICVALAAQCPPAFDPTVEREFLNWAESELKNASPNYTRALLQTIGTRDDGEHAQAMIDCLKHPEESVQSTALWALREVSGLGLSGDPTPWNAWLKEEVAWHQRVRPRLKQDLDSRDAEKMVGALRSYSERRTRRGELAQEIAPVLENPRPELRRIACDVLGRLGSTAANPALLRALEDPDSTVVEAARQALAAISGIEIPRDPVQARSVLGT